MKLLIVEENAGMRRLLRSLVEELHGTVSECSDGEEAFTMCAVEQPNWVLLDLNLAIADGIALTRQISAAYPQIKVVIVTDEDDERLRAAALAAGACHAVSKENLLELRRLLLPAAGC